MYTGMPVIELRLPKSAVEPLLRATEARLRELRLEVEATKKCIRGYEGQTWVNLRGVLREIREGRARRR